MGYVATRHSGHERSPLGADARSCQLRFAPALERSRAAREGWCLLDIVRGLERSPLGADARALVSTGSFGFPWFAAARWLQPGAPTNPLGAGPRSFGSPRLLPPPSNGAARRACWAPLGARTDPRCADTGRGASGRSRPCVVPRCRRGREDEVRPPPRPRLGCWRWPAAAWFFVQVEKGAICAVQGSSSCCRSASRSPSCLAQRPCS